MPTAEELADEAHRARKVRQTVDIATAFIVQARMPRAAAESLVALVRDRVLALFPDGEATYELIYAPRFRRLLDECCPEPPAPRGTVIPFPNGGG